MKIVQIDKGHSAYTEKLTPDYQTFTILIFLGHGNSLLLNQGFKDG